MNGEFEKSEPTNLGAERPPARQLSPEPYVCRLVVDIYYRLSLRLDYTENLNFQVGSVSTTVAVAVVRGAASESCTHVHTAQLRPFNPFFLLA